MKTLEDLHRDALFLHAFAQGVEELFDTIKTESSPASNAMPAFFESLIERASRLQGDIEALDEATRGTRK
ncbi:hypothetical protein PAF17_19000 [Paracoccus sp. Z330]|uniref:Uncharacterized protein n=1 Tax=Paracoccus onchidii TaxID=3017813 RepID=A0ABT4ZJM3_9RHOB|nr:hypothetical protein [Paracoccus onchidii]MDB6179563.1 hypothetical protein [Paracoccus onchidii]